MKRLAIVGVVFLSSGCLLRPLYQKYRTNSDVWSYGMLMLSLGHKPSEDKTVDEGKHYVYWAILTEKNFGCWNRLAIDWPLCFVAV